MECLLPVFGFPQSIPSTLGDSMGLGFIVEAYEDSTVSALRLGFRVQGLGLGFSV